MRTFRIERDGYALAVGGIVYCGADLIEADPSHLPEYDALHGALERGDVVEVPKRNATSKRSKQIESDESCGPKSDQPVARKRATRKSTTKKATTRKPTE